MENETNLTAMIATVSNSFTFVVVERINALAILTENFIVALCLFTHRKRFSKQEFWFFLVCLNINDIFVGFTMMTMSFINYEIFTNLTVCTVLWICVIGSQLSFLYNVLGICVYRFLFIVNTGRHRLAWKSNMTGIQLCICFVIAMVYSSGTFFFSPRNSDTLERCEIDVLLGEDIQFIGIYLSVGVAAPLVSTDVLYLILFRKIRDVSRRQKSRFNSRHNTQTSSKDYQFSSYKQDASPDKDIPTHRDSHCQSRDTATDNLVNTGLRTNKMCSYSTKSNFSKIGQGQKTREIGRSMETKFECRYTSSCDSDDKRMHDNNIFANKKEVTGNDDGASDSSNKKRNSFNGLITRTYTNRINIVYGGRGRDSQKQSIHLIGVILFVVNLTMFLPTCIKLASIFVPFNLSSMATEILFLLMMNNALLNPWIYTLQSTDFRRAIKDNWLKIYRRANMRDHVF